MSNSFFVTGCVRSGTTLLEKLLCNHPELSVLSQPFPSLYIKIKKAFLNSIGIDEYFVLSNYVSENRYSFSDFNTYLNNELFSTSFVQDGINSNYSGNMTAGLKYEENKEQYLKAIYESLTKQNSHNVNAKLFGSKEVLCEEFAPYFMNNGIKVVHIIRDPRDVISSIKKGDGDKFIGNVKPLLFELRNWRKSVQLAIQCKGNPNFMSLHYEDLIQNTDESLQEICDFLNINDFKPAVFSQGIRTQQGDIWSSNSSFEGVSGAISSSSIGKHKELLSQSVNDYISTICFPELTLQGKAEEIKNIQEEIIRNFKEPVPINDSNFDSLYSSTRHNIDYEIDRIRSFKENALGFKFELDLTTK